MALDGSPGDLLSPEKFQESFRNRHQKEADRLRCEIEDLVKHARVLLHGYEPKSRLPPRQPAGGKRGERDKELETVLEKANWYRHEIKKLRRDLESWDRVCGGPAYGSLAQERDPMETYNHLVERRKELQRLQRNGVGLDRVAANQRQAEREQNMLSPEVEDRLRRAKDEVAQQKRLNIRLQSERQKMIAAKKQAEQELRTANAEFRSKASQVQRAPGPEAVKPVAESKHMAQLRRDADILSEAMRQDQRKHKVSQRDDDQQLDMTRATVERIRSEVAGHEVEVMQLKAMLRSEIPAPLPGGGSEMLSPCNEAAPTRVSPNGQSLAESTRVSPTSQSGVSDGRPPPMPTAASVSPHQHQPLSPSSQGAVSNAGSRPPALPVSPHQVISPASDAAESSAGPKRLAALAAAAELTGSPQPASTDGAPTDARSRSPVTRSLAADSVKSVYQSLSGRPSVTGSPAKLPEIQGFASVSSGPPDSLTAQSVKSVYERVAERPSVTGSPAARPALDQVTSVRQPSPGSARQSSVTSGSARQPSPGSARQSSVMGSPLKDEASLKADYKQYCAGVYEKVSARPSVAGTSPPAEAAPQYKETASSLADVPDEIDADTSAEADDMAAVVAPSQDPVPAKATEDLLDTASFLEESLDEEQA